MKKFWKPMQTSESRIEDMVDLAGKGKLSRRRFVSTLTAMGASATAVATFVVAAEQISQRNAQVTRPPTTPTEQQNLQSHDQHLVAQQRGASDPTAPTPTPQASQGVQSHVEAFMQDYHPEAVVEDMLVGVPLVGQESIKARKIEEFKNLRGITINVVHRFATGSQVVAEWVASGVLHGEFLGITGDGAPFSIRGLTVVTRDANGKITRESLYYDLEEVKRQLGEIRTI